MAFAHRLKAIAYLIKPRPYALEKPVVIQFPVIDICNSRCQMCRIWENKKSDEITPALLRQGLRNSLFSEVTAVGLNGGEPTLRKDLAELANVLFEELPKLRSIALITNAYNHSEVIGRIAEVGEVVHKHDGHFDVMVSLDGFGEMHDRVRGKPGNFERAQKVIDFLTNSPLVHNVRIGCTIIKENVYGLAELLEFCYSRGLYIKYRLGIPHQRLYTENIVAPYALSFEEKYHVAEFLEGLIKHYETNEHQRFFYRSLVDQLVRKEDRKAGCDWQHRGATITAKGELLYCAVQSKVLGNIAKDDSARVYFANQPHLHDIIRSKCAACNHDYVGLPPRSQYARQLAIQALKKMRAEKLVRRIYERSFVGKAVQRVRYERRLHAFRQLARSKPVGARADKCRGERSVLICGWYGTETLGDKAILGGVIKTLSEILGPIRVSLASLFPYVSNMTRLQMPELEGCQIVDCKEGIRVAGNMDLVVFGGGPLMALNELAEMESIFLAAHRSNVPTVILGCGVGPVGHEWHNKSIIRILKMASLRVYRDEQSKKLAGILGVDSSFDLVAEDPAFTWLEDQYDGHETPSDEQMVLLLGLRDFPYLQYASHLPKADGLAIKEHYECEIISALEQLLERNPNLKIRPLPMCTNHFGDDDRWFYRCLFRSSAIPHERIDSSLLGAELTPRDYCQAFGAAHAVLAMRFHSLVFALGLRVPVVAIDYTLGKGKVHALAERFGVPNQSVAQIDSEFIVQHVEKLLRMPTTQSTPVSPSLGRLIGPRLLATMNSSGTC